MQARNPNETFTDPATRYGSPENVVKADHLTKEQKIEILRSWQYDVAEESVAVEEGMPGDEPPLMRRIVKALEELAGPLDLEHTGPGKQHGISRGAVRKDR